MNRYIQFISNQCCSKDRQIIACGAVNDKILQSAKSVSTVLVNSSGSAVTNKDTVRTEKDFLRKQDNRQITDAKITAEKIFKSR